MQFKIENGTPTEERRILRWAHVIARELGIADSYGCVHIRLGDLGRAGGQMIPYPAPGGVFFLELNHKDETMLPALSHELVHVRQVIRGEHYINQSTGLAHWHGQTYDANAVTALARQDMAFYRSLPWEVEAHELMWPLAELAALETGEV